MNTLFIPANYILQETHSVTPHKGTRLIYTHKLTFPSRITRQLKRHLNYKTCSFLYVSEHSALKDAYIILTELAQANPHLISINS